MPQADTPTDPLRIIASCDSFVLASVTETTSPSVLIRFTRLNIPFRKYGLPYGLPVSLCTLHLIVANFNATLGMGGWPGLAQQELSPCK